MTSTAAAPSFNPDEFPAVTVPPSFLKAGLSLARLSMGIAARTLVGADENRVAFALRDGYRDDFFGEFARCRWRRWRSGASGRRTRPVFRG
jgi:hypothetical protein